MLSIQERLPQRDRRPDGALTRGQPLVELARVGGGEPLLHPLPLLLHLRAEEAEFQGRAVASRTDPQDRESKERGPQLIEQSLHSMSNWEAHCCLTPRIRAATVFAFALLDPQGVRPSMKSSSSVISHSSA